MMYPSLSELNTDGCNISLFSALTRPSRTFRSGLPLQLPHTFYFEYGVPKLWFYTASDGTVRARQAKDFGRKDIERAICSGRQLAAVKGDQAIAAQVLSVPFHNYQQPPSGADEPVDSSHWKFSVFDAVEDSRNTITQYLTAQAVQEMLNGDPSKQPRACILQRFLDPQGWYNTSLRATWAPRVCIVECVRSPHSLRDVWKTSSERGDTFENELAIHVAVPSVINEGVKRVCNVVATHLQGVYGCTVTGMLLYFKVDANRDLHFLFSGSIRAIANVPAPYDDRSSPAGVASDRDGPRASVSLRPRHSTTGLGSSVNSPTNPKLAGSRRLPALRAEPLNVWHEMRSVERELFQQDFERRVAAAASEPLLGVSGGDGGSRSPRLQERKRGAHRQTQHDDVALQIAMEEGVGAPGHGARSTSLSPVLRGTSQERRPHWELRHSPDRPMDEVYAAAARQLGIPVPKCLERRRRRPDGGVASPASGTASVLLSIGDVRTRTVNALPPLVLSRDTAETLMSAVPRFLSSSASPPSAISPPNATVLTPLHVREDQNPRSVDLPAEADRVGARQVVAAEIPSSVDTTATVLPLSEFVFGTEGGLAKPAEERPVRDALRDLMYCIRGGGGLLLHATGDRPTSPIPYDRSLIPRQVLLDALSPLHVSVDGPGMFRIGDDVARLMQSSPLEIHRRLRQCEENVEAVSIVGFPQESPRLMEDLPEFKLFHRLRHSVMDDLCGNELVDEPPQLPTLLSHDV